MSPGRGDKRRREPFRRSDAGAVALPFTVTRVLVLAAGLLAAVVIGYDPLPTEQAAWRTSSNLIANLPARWDAYWYLDIATNGYRWDPGSPIQQNVVFFPAYPMLLRGVGWLLRGQVLWGGVGVSLVAFWWALMTLRRLAVLDLDSRASDAAVWLLASYPFAIFFGAAYTESLYLLALLSAWLACRQGRWRHLAAWGLLLGLTRPTGCLMSVPLVCLVFANEPFATPGSSGHRQVRRTQPLLAAAAPIAGMLIYWAYLRALTGEPFAWITGQAAWGVLSSGLSTPVDPRWGPPLAWRWSDLVVHAGNSAALVFALAAVVPVWRRFGLAPAAVLVVSIVPPLVTHGILSMGRFTSVLFPLFLWLASVVPASRARLFVGTFLGLQLLGSALFYTWRILV